jgi:CRISPR-associated endoribonuclease Cas2 subtype I-E
MIEADTGLFIGKASQRVRELIWQRIEHSGVSHAVMVFSARNEQGYDIEVLGDSVSVVDMDGLKLIKALSAPDVPTKREAPPQHEEMRIPYDEDERHCSFISRTAICTSLWMGANSI